MSATPTASAAAPLRPAGDRSEVDLLAKHFRVFGDPTRLAILELLGGGERSVGELVDALGAPQPRVSNHLACLRWCGFVSARREHRSVFYAVSDPRVLEVVALARGLLGDHAGAVAACARVDERER